MNKKTLGMSLLVAGSIVLIISLAADLVGLGQVPVFGYKQIIGSVVGAAAAVAGYIIAFRK
jgi:hypothetical protein